MKSQNDRLELAVIISILLHLLLIGLLLIGSLFTNMIQPAAGGSGGDSDSIEAVMVDTGQVAAEYGRLQAPKQGVKPKVEKQEEPQREIVEDKPTPEEIAEQQEREKALALAEQKKQEEIERLKEEQRKQEMAKQEQLKQEQLKKEQEATRLKAAEAAKLKAEAEAKRLEAAAKQAEEERKAKEAEKQQKLKAELEAKAKAEKEAKERAEKEAKEKAEKEAIAKEKAEKEAKAKAEAKEKAEKEAKLKAEKEAKAKAEKEAKAKAAAEAKAKEAARAQQLLDGGDIGGGSSAGGNKNTSGSQGIGNAKSVGDGMGTEDRGYENLIKKKLARFYRVEESFRGRECRVKLFLERDGRITNYQVVSGPEDICRAAVSAVVSAKDVPRAPSDETYSKYKSPIIRFSLKIQ